MANRFIMRAVLISLLLIYLIDLYQLAIANEIPSDYKKKEVTSQQTESAIQKQPGLKFVTVMWCDERKPQELCAVGRLEPGTSLTILMKEDKTCAAKALEQTFVESEIGSSLGSKLKTGCDLRDSYDSIAVVNEPVVDFKIMDYPFIKDIKDAKMIESFDKEIKRKQLLDNFIRRHPTNKIDNMRPKLHVFSYPMAEVYFADYSTESFSDAPLIMINKNIYYVVSDVNECWDIDSQFRLNSRFFVNVHKCTCATDGCWSEYVNVTKEGFIKISNLPN